jgi:hypothetical protein
MRGVIVCIAGGPADLGAGAAARGGRFDAIAASVHHCSREENARTVADRQIAIQAGDCKTRHL